MDENIEAAPPIAMIDRLHRDLSTATILFQEAIARKLGVSAAERKCLSVLWELGEATPGVLMQATGLSSGAITGIVDRLVRAGHAERVPHPSDRRSLIVRPLDRDALMAKVGPAFDALRGAMEALLAGYSATERTLIERHLRATIAVLREQTEAAAK